MPAKSLIATTDKPERVNWCSMVQRCTNPNRADFARYGAVGVYVCERWRKFENFYSDMGPRPSAKHSLDRIDSTRGYEPGNVRWATPKEQARNRKSTRLIAFAGKAMCIKDWASEVGLSSYVVAYRLRAGWPIERALTAPVYAGRAD